MSHKPSMPIASLEDQSPEVRAQLEAMTTPRNDGLPELLNCPFCGAQGVRTLVGHADIQYFHCDERTQGCGAVVSFLPRKIGSSAFAAWKRRASPSVGGVRVQNQKDCAGCDGSGYIPVQVCCGKRRGPDGDCCGDADIDYDRCAICAAVADANNAAEVGEVEALRLADRLEANDTNDTDCIEAAALLRRLAGLGRAPPGG